jgi:TatD DNase family protein
VPDPQTAVDMIDTHCHLNFDSYDEDRESVIQRAVEAGVRRVINPAVDLETSRAALQLARDYPGGVYASIGFHPNSTADFEIALLDEIRPLADHPQVIAVGEIGLDYYWDKSPKAAQHRAFEAQMALAAELELPVIIHNRDASDDVIAILENWVADLPPSLKDRPGVMHSFSGTQAIAERALAAGFYLGFTGPLTFKKADETRAIAAQVPLDRLLVETDGPFLTPHPHRGKRNEPAYIPLIVDRLAGLHRVTVEQMAQITTENAVRLFKLP